MPTNVLKDSEEANSTLVRSVRVLFALAEAGKALPVTKLASVLDLPASTTHRILNVLRHGGYVAQDDESGNYSPGVSFLRMVTALASTSNFPSLVNGVMRGLVDESGESTFYCSYLRELGRLRFVANLHSHHAIQYITRSDVTYSVLWGASGRSIASRLPEEELKAIYSREHDSKEGQSQIPEWRGMLKIIRQIRADGYSVSEAQRYEGSHAIAAPVLGEGDTVLGCIGISMPTARRESEKTDRCIRLVVEAARDLSQAASTFMQRQ